MRSLLVTVAGVLFAFAAPLSAENLVPAGPNRSPDYFCTWNVQGYAVSYASGDAQRQAMTESNLFGHDGHGGWADLYPSVRGGLFLVMDDSWDVPLSGDPQHFGSLILDAGRFPTFTGEPAERLRKLNDAVKTKGWRGLGGWVCAQQAPALATKDDDAYWTQRLDWMREAGIRYWKVDWGKRAQDADWRRHLTDLAARHAPDLIVEHALAEGALASAAVYRTYEVENVIAAPVTIARVAHLLQIAPKGSPTLINCEDEPYVAAGLGAAIGVMRHPAVGPLPDGRQDFVFPPVGRDLKRRLDEVARCVNWHRIASPIPLGTGGDHLDKQDLKDSWTLAAGETYTAYHPGDTRDAAAPARIARGGLPLPTVDVPPGRPAPYVLVARSPNGPVAIAAIGRTHDRTYAIAPARITQDVGTADTVGLFGVFEAVTLHLDRPVGARHVLAQDFAGDACVDITSRVTRDGNAITLPGSLISQIGLSAAHAGDLSEPGSVLVIR